MSDVAPITNASTLTKIVCGLTGILLVGVWCWFSHALTEVALDYPLRRAGENEIYPALGTLPFYGGCMRALLQVMMASSFVWVIPFVITLLLLFKAFAVTSWWSRCLLFLTPLILPPLACAAYLILRTMH